MIQILKSPALRTSAFKTAYGCRYMLKALLLLFVITLGGCNSTELVKPKSLIKYQSSSSFHHLAYKGSDKNFHYFVHSDKISSSYKVSRSNLNWKQEFPYNSGHKPSVVWPGTIEKILSSRTP